MKFSAKSQKASQITILEAIDTPSQLQFRRKQPILRIYRNYRRHLYRSEILKSNKEFYNLQLKVYLLIEVINGDQITIQNAKLQHEDYPYTFHQFYEDKETILVLYLIVPGIRHDSIQMNVEGVSFRMTAFLDREYFRIFRAQQIEIKGRLHNNVKTNVFTSEYKHGILKITLVIDSSN